jgi:hypothetical protein
MTYQSSEKNNSILTHVNQKLAEEIDDKYVRKDVWLERQRHIDERCGKEASDLTKISNKQDSTDKKITATLVFAIITLISIVVAVISHSL